MPIYDMLCGDCGHLISNEYLTFEEFDLMKEAGGMPCPKCPGMMHTKPGRVGVKFGLVMDHRGQKYPGSKREARQMMEKRYEQRNAKLEKLPPNQKERMIRFMERFGVRKTAPSSPDHA